MARLGELSDIRHRQEPSQPTLESELTDDSEMWRLKTVVEQFYHHDLEDVTNQDYSSSARFEFSGAVPRTAVLGEPPLVLRLKSGCGGDDAVPEEFGGVPPAQAAGFADTSGSNMMELGSDYKLKGFIAYQV